MAASKLIVTSGTGKITGQFFPSAPGGLVSSLILNHAYLIIVEKKNLAKHLPNIFIYHINFEIEFGILRKRALTGLQIKIEAYAVRTV
ncbi:hypothetical protein T03_8101 [Trichinella britovi]|uniref:Uncharacterized protein n=1 Tax=Trichinella britovi TaxID=45882 RepID=A0A0V1CEQ5_TRIBR|nr:hypothetical protein T03_8101 [Trichinella britovi]